MYEDWMLDDDFRVEECSDLIEEEGMDEVFRFMIPCKNCGELRPKSDPSIRETGMCYLCTKSEFHQEKRGQSRQASNNCKTLSDIVDRINRLYP